MKAITIGSNTVQQKDINWSKRILGKEALAHMKTNIIIQVFKDNQKLKNIPLNIGLNKLYLYTYHIDTS